jgi:Family of unknown function (DUF695)
MRELLVMSLLFAILGLVGCKGKTEKGEWSVATGTDKGLPMIVRFRSEVPAEINAKDYPHLVAISWKYKAQTNGTPSREDTLRMEELEDLLDGALEAKRQAFMTAAVTCNGLREWQWYSKDSDEFTKLLNEALAGKPPFPIEISHQQDPDWSAYRTIRDGAKR